MSKKRKMLPCLSPVQLAWVSTSDTLTCGFTIRYGVSIENAKGGEANDVLIGNDGANVFVGLGGADTAAPMH